MQKFAGSNYDHERDAPRLTTQHGRIFNVMKDAIPYLERDSSLDRRPRKFHFGTT